VRTLFLGALNIQVERMIDDSEVAAALDEVVLATFGK
jgi:hypothetical protein